MIPIAASLRGPSVSPSPAAMVIAVAVTAADLLSPATLGALLAR